MAGHFSALLSAEPAGGARVPVTVLTGFLGSGKTTLLNRLLSQPELEGTAVIVNEFGEVGIDHDLITHTTEDTVLLSNGCLCCAVRGDLVEALCALAQRPGPPLRQVLIETSGLADPAPILRVLMGDPAVSRHFALRGVACTVDAVLGLRTLAAHAEAAQQAAVADLLVLTKTDLLPAQDKAEGGGIGPVLQAVARINPDASVVQEPVGQIGALLELMHRPQPPGPESAQAPAYRPPASRAGALAGATEPVHAGGIASFVLVRDTPLPLEAFSHWLDMVVATRGVDLLRVKGLVCTADDPGRPLLVHGVQHLFPPPERLPAWPSGDTRTRLVFITRGVDGEALSDTLDILVRRHARAAPA